MTTQSWSTRVRHDSDAVFREWGSELNTKLAAIGLVQTADTGQINWTTVTRPAANTDAGYEIWRFNDSLQATAPIFFRFNYGTHGTVSAPRISIGVGISANGAGVLTGVDGLTPTQRLILANVSQTVDTARQSLMCHVPGFFGFSWKIGSASPEGGFFICRTCDTTGAPTATGAIVGWGSGATSGMTATQAMKFSSTAFLYTVKTSAVNTMLGFNPQSHTNTSVGADIQCALGWMPTPRVAPIFGVCGVLDSELSVTTTFTATLVGTTPRTFIALNSTFGPFGPESSVNAGALKYAMLWE